MIKDHYVLAEDLNEVTNELEKIHTYAMDVIRIAKDAEFHEREELLRNINQSMKVLQAYNEKKLKRDAGYLGDVMAWRK